MLQTVHQKKAASPASSIYCRWMRESRGEKAHLVAVWIDSAMRCFERELLPKSEAETTHPVRRAGCRIPAIAGARGVHEIET
jgi:hypothetical protein